MAAEYDIKINQGETFLKVITWYDNANNNMLASATSAQAQLREEKSNTSPVIADFTCTFAANNASLSLGLSANTTLDIAIRRGYWDLFITYPSEVVNPLSGKSYTNFAVTQPGTT